MNIELYKQNQGIIQTTGRIPQGLMPTTKEDSVMVLAQYPNEYYATLKPVSIKECITSPVCTLGAFRRATSNDHTGDMTVKAIVLMMLTDIVAFFNVGKTMTPNQLAQTTELIIENYVFLKIDDFKLLFTNAKKGDYGKVYDRIDGNIMISWIDTYLNDRMNAGESMSYLEHDKVKANEKRGGSFLEIVQQHSK